MPDDRTQLLAKFADPLRVFGQLLLTPTVRHRAQQRDQGRWRRKDYALVDSLLNQGRILFESSTEEGLARQEQHDKFGRRFAGSPSMISPPAWSYDRAPGARDSSAGPA